MKVKNDKMPAGHSAPAGLPHGAMPAAGDDAPWRAAPLSASELVEHGRQLAARHQLRGRAGAAGAVSANALVRLLAANADAIATSCDALDRAVRTGVELPPAGARLLDQYHLFEAQLRLARGQLRHAMPDLPVLAPENAVRIWRLVLDVVAHGDGHIDADALARFLAAYQEGAPLRIAELDALPALLRLALIDNLRRLAARAARVCAGREQAAAWAARLLDTAETRPGDLILLVADMARGGHLGNSGFVAELARRLHGRGAATVQVLDWIDARLADGGGSIAQHTQRERSEQADDAVSAGNSLASLRLLGGIDWRAFAEQLGAVDALLRDDPDGSYARMDGATRDRYRHAVARLARSFNTGEAEVAQEALALAGIHRAPGEGGLDTRTRHVGHYLIGAGYAALEARLGGGHGFRARLRARARAMAGAGPSTLPTAMRIGATAVLTLSFMIATVVHAHQGGAGPLLLILIGMLALPGASHLAHALARLMKHWLARPSSTPRIEVEGGIPAAAPTLVAVSAQVAQAAELAALCDDLEVRHLGNRDPRLRFCLLLDLPDAASETVPEDEALLAQAGVAIEALNGKHGHAHSIGTIDENGAPRTVVEQVEPFMLLVRARSWSVDQQAWIGRERRRGQLLDLNAWLCGARERFLLAAGNTGAGAEMRYVIALDAHTLLPPDAARSLVAAMAHPLHQPVQDDGGRVLEGHAMLLPEPGFALPTRGGMRYERLWPSGAGTWASTGAGCGAAPDEAQGWAAIYDVDAWRRAMGDELRDEGRAAPGLVEQDRLRAGRVRDLRLDTLHPASYGEHVLRRHRDARAAWQEARRLGRGAGRLRSARLRWRMVDTLGASLAAPASLALLLLCWSLLAAPGFWTAAVLAVFCLPALLGMLVALANRPPDAPWRQHLDAWARGARVPLVRATLSVAFLPHTAWFQLDAIVRGLWRRDVTHRNLLEMRPPALARSSRAMENNWRAMWCAPLLAVGAAVLLTFANPYALFATAPLLLLWFLSPVLAWWSSQPGRRSVRLGATQTQFLHALARRSWAFFEQHGAAAHGLALHAVFEHPEPAIDTRLSSAGMGWSLLATLSARDFGFLPLGPLLERSEQALASMALLERWNGHLFGWYDGATLGPIEPARVDTGASGSMVLALRTFAAGLDELPARPIVDGAVLDGIRAALLVLRDHATPSSQQALDALEDALSSERCRATDTLPGLIDCLRGAASGAARLVASLPEDADPALRAWSARLLDQCEAQLQDLCALAPWMRAAQEYVLGASLTRIPTLHELAALELPSGSEGLAQLVDEGRACARERIGRLAALAEQARAMARMDFGGLVDPATGLLATGFQVRDARMDGDSCDLLASTARMASFAAVAQGQLPQRHWYSLGRPLRMSGAGALLLSRHGALADYLAPQLLMPSWRDSLLGGAGQALVRLQVLHAKARGLLWGFSDSGCNAVDASARYRFGHFGLPAAAMQRGRADELVAAPHAAALALAVAPALAAANLQNMAAQGLLGELGFYEALDYAPARLPQGERQMVVRAQVARHQAMTLLALAGHLLNEPMQRRFCRDAEFRAALGLLQEPLPASGADPALRYGAAAAAAAGNGAAAAHPYARVIGAGGSALPEVQLLSNGRYHLAIDSDGASVSHWEERLLTRPGRGETGMACHVRDSASGRIWSNTLLPARTPAQQHETVLSEGRVSFHRVDDGIAMQTDVVVAPEDDVELRRIRIVNRGSQARTLELCSSVALAGPPLEAGGRSGVMVEFDAAIDSLLCVTTPDAPVIVHRMAVRDIAAPLSVESSRARFIGRAHEIDTPQALGSGDVLPGLEPEPDQPLLALRRVLTLAPQQEVTLDLLLGVASSRAVARELAARYGAAHAVDHAIEAAWTQTQAFLRRSQVSEADAQLYARLAGCLLQPVPALRADPAVIARNVRGRADLQAYGITGALPVLLFQLGQGPDADLARQLLQAHAWWRSRGLAVDLLVLCDSRAAREGVMQLAASLLDPDSFERPGGVHLHLKHEVPQEDRILLRASARVLLASEGGDLAEQLRRAARPGAALPPPFVAASAAPAWQAAEQPLPQPELTFDNGIGGFTQDGREYLVRCGPGLPVAPAPWDNLLASAHFGSRVSERGHASSWNGARDVRLTGEEAFYLRDEDTGAFWSPTPWPAPSPQPYLTRHGFGYSVFEHRAHGIHSELRCFVAQDAPLKYNVLRLRNDSDAARRLSVTGYLDWVLDAADAVPGLQVVTGVDLASGALFARNAFGEGMRDKVAFFHVDAEQVATGCDRDEFIGRRGSIARPAALERAGLSGVNAANGAGRDPCAALQVVVGLEPGAEIELVFMLGVAGPGNLDASRVVQQHGGAAAAASAWQRLRDWWDVTLGALQVRTPDPALDLRVNGWLPYQAISAMLGEPDPAMRLQSALACAHARPTLLVEQLLRAARDFARLQSAGQAPAVEDFLWLPYALAHYVALTDDAAPLSALPFGQGGEGGEGGGDVTGVAARDDLYQHCVHGLRGCLRFGPRGLPPAAARLHEEDSPGRVESVGLGFFMASVLQRFALVADRRGDFGFATTCRGAALALRAQCEEHGWDGEWYRWTWLDSANALGSIANAACRAELSTQCWALQADAAQGARALRAVGQRLIDGAQDVVLLCDPPVDGHWSERVAASPGQDHRAAAWAAAGFARLGEAGRAWELANMLDPLARSSTLDACARYAAPPYFLTAGLRTIAPHAGRATGDCATISAAWAWLAIVEALLGVEREGAQLHLRPHLAPGWDGFSLRYRYGSAHYEIAVHATNSDGNGNVAEGVLLDGQPCANWRIGLRDDRRDHKVEVRIAGTPAIVHAGPEERD